MSAAHGPAVVLYTKRDCPLCDHLKSDLAWLAEQLPFTVEERDIERDADLLAQFRYLIPVLEVGGVFYYPPHDLLQLRQMLAPAGGASAT